MHGIFWIFIADASRARIVVRTPGGCWQTVAAFRLEPLPGAAELGSDRPGRSFESAGVARRAIEPRHDPAKLQRRSFVCALARFLDSACLDRRFDRLALVAPSRMLGEMRSVLADHTRAAVSVESPKDLTKIPDDEIADHLTPILAETRRLARA